MQREARIYAVYALIGVALFLYATSISVMAWERFGVSVTLAVYVVVALLFAFLATLYGWLAFIFSARSLISINCVSGGFELLLAKPGAPRPISVQRIRHIRTIGKQFAKNESTPAFAIVAAGGQVWVAEASSYQAADSGAAQ